MREKERKEAQNDIFALGVKSHKVNKIALVSDGQHLSLVEHHQMCMLAKLSKNA